MPVASTRLLMPFEPAMTSLRGNKGGAQSVAQSVPSSVFPHEIRRVIRFASDRRRARERDSSMGEPNSAL